MTPKRKASGGRHWPRVSLVTPSYNQAQFLEDAIQSVLSQDYPDLDYIIIDGGSIDGSPEIIQEYEGYLAFWISEPDEGQADAINKGWRRASGEYVWWLNSDDMLTPGSLHTAVEFLEQYPEVDLVYGDIVHVDEAGRRVGLWPYPDFDLADFLSSGLHSSQPGALLRRSALERVGPLDIDYHYAMDSEFWLRLALAGGQLARVAAQLAMFRVHQEAKSQMGSGKAVEERYRLAESVEEQAERDDRLKESLVPRMWSSIHIECSRIWMSAGQYQNCGQELSLALKTSPSLILRFESWALAALALMGLVLGFKRTQRIRLRLRHLRRAFRAG